MDTETVHETMLSVVTCPRCEQKAGPESQFCPNCAREWLRRNPDELSTIELAAQLMHRFSQIHPFTDGNGRVGRLLMNLVLIRAGYPFITNISYRDRARYLRSLLEADEGNLKRLVGLVARSVEGALDSYLHVIEEPRVFSLAEAGRRIGVDADYLGLPARRGILPAFKAWGEVVRV